MTESTTTEPVVYAKGTWQDSLQKSSTLLDRSAKARKTASNLLWTGAVAGINEWMPNSSTDVSAEGLYASVMEALGTARKGDASKIKTVAVGVREHGLDLASYPNLSKAYAAAADLTKGAKTREVEDNAAETAIESITAPKSAGTPESAALLLLSKGLDGAVVAILDALGASNFDAHRAFIRSTSTEVASRVQAAKPKPAPKAPAAAKGAAKTATKATTKAKPAPAKAKAKPAPAKPSAEVTEPVHAGDDVPSGDDAPVQAANQTKAKPAPVKAKAKPVARR